MLAAKLKQRLVEAPERAVRFFLRQVGCKPRTGECFFRLRIRKLSLPAKCAKFLGASLADGLAKTGVAVAGEIEKRRGFAVLLAHEQQRHEGRKQVHTGGQFQALKVHQGTEAFAEGAIADLIVVLRTDHIICGFERWRRVAMPLAPVPRILTIVEPPMLQRSCQMPRFTKVFVVAGFLAGQQRVHRMMKIVAPLRRHLESTLAPRPQHPRII